MAAASFETVRSELLAAVKESFHKNDIEIASKKYPSISLQESEKKSIMDHVFREYLITLLENPKEEIAVFENYMELCIEACRRELCSTATPVLVMSDMFDTLTLDRCELLFKFVENGVNIWREPCFFGACKNSLLRLCNDLLRRLSRSQNTVFCGRILLFLAKFFPFSERSGLNIVSEFNLDNVTEYGSGVGKDIDGEKEEEDATTKADTKIKIDYNLYCKFWALQDFFRSPNQCYNKLKWRAFTSHAGDVLSAFGSFKLEDIQGHSTRKNGDNTDDEMKDVESCTKQQYFAKFLTNQKLLDLQLSDSNFRRFVLVQFLIIFQYLGSTVKFRQETDELKPEQMDWVNESTKQVYALLGETPPKGKEFAESVQHILKREEHWNSWKNNGCPEFKPPKAIKTEESTTLPAKPRPTKRLGDQMKSAYAQKKFVMGNPELTKLWNLSTNNLDACRSKERNFLPSLEGYFEESIQQANPDSMIEESYKRVNDGNFGWRALRLLARRSPHFFIHSNNPINKLPEYLETMIRRIARDLPSTNSDETGRPQIDGMEEDLQQNSQDAEDDELMPEEKEEETSKDAGAIETAEAEEEESLNEKQAMLTPALIKAVATEVGSEWTKLASKLGYKADEIEYFQSEYSSDFDRAHHVLKLWSQDDEDASVAGLSYTLTGLGLEAAAQALQ